MAIVSTPSGRSLRSWVLSHVRHHVSSAQRRAIVAGSLLAAASACQPDNVSPSFTINFTPPPSSTATPGSTGTVDVTVTRTGGFTGAVTLSFDPGITAVAGAAVTVPAGQTTGHLSYTVPSGAAIGPVQVYINADATGQQSA